jgi:hypothetical protein
MPKRPAHDRSGSATESAEKPLTRAEAVEAMDRFRKLTRGLLSVLHKEAQAEEKSGRPRKSTRGRPLSTKPKN